MESIRIVLTDLQNNETIVNSLPKAVQSDGRMLFSLDSYQYNYSTESVCKIKPYEGYVLKVKSGEKLEEKQEVSSFDSIAVYEKTGENKLVSLYNYIDLNSAIKRYNNMVGEGTESGTRNLGSREEERFNPISVRTSFLSNPKILTDPSKIFINVMTFEERELLKKALLSFGYGRWENIQECFKDQRHLGLREKTISEIRSYSNSLIKSIADNLNFQNIGLKNLLLSVIKQPIELPSDGTDVPEFDLLKKRNEDFKDDINICVNSRDWDLNSIRQRAKPWAKRLQTMHRINILIEGFQKMHMKLVKRRAVDIFDFSGLLDFIEKSYLTGQKPESWWTKFHDIHLIYSTFTNGYANYSQAFELKQSNIEFPGQWYDEQERLRKLYIEKEITDFYSENLLIRFPNADAITRRLKKLISIIYRLSNEKNEESLLNTQTTPFLDEKIDDIPEENVKRIISFVKEFGLPLDQKTKRESFEDLRSHLNMMEVPITNLEILVNVCKLVAFCLVNNKKNECSEYDFRIHNRKIIEIRNCFTKRTAEEFLRNLNIINLIRKNEIDQKRIEECIGPFKAKIAEILSSDRQILFDKEKLLSLCTVEKINTITEYISKFGFQNIDSLLKTLEFDDKLILLQITELFVDFLKPSLTTVNHHFKKRKNDYLQKNIHNNSGGAGGARNYKGGTKKNKLEMIMQNQGVINMNDLRFPITISSSLKLIALGQIKLSPYYHSEHNLFPVGFITVRTYASMFHKNSKCEYRCEILEGEEKPIYKVICSEDPNNPIIRDSSTGCWIYICKKVNEIAENRKSKIAISGTERFGLLDTVVISLLQNLENADKCTKYIFKTNKI